MPVGYASSAGHRRARALAHNSTKEEVMSSRQIERIQWLGLTVMGQLAGLALVLLLGLPIFAIADTIIGTPIVLSIVGLSLGTAQWPIIRRHLSPSWWWVVVSALGMSLGLTIGVTLVEQIGRALIGGPVNFRMLDLAARAVSFGTIGLMGGGALGLAQWFVLRRHAPRCSSWILVNAWSLGVGLACGSLLADAFMMSSDSIASAVILVGIGSAVAGACTAMTLVEIFSPQHNSQPMRVDSSNRGNSCSVTASGNA